MILKMTQESEIWIMIRKMREEEGKEADREKKDGKGDVRKLKEREVAKVKNGFSLENDSYDNWKMQEGIVSPWCW